MFRKFWGANRTDVKKDERERMLKILNFFVQNMTWEN